MAENPILEAASGAETEEESNLDLIRSSLAKVTEVANATRAGIERGRVKFNELAPSISDSILSIGASEQIISKEKQVAAKQAQNATISAYEAAGGAEMQKQLLAQYVEDQKQTRALLEEKEDIVDDKFTGLAILDNIINDFRSVQLDSEIEVAVAQQAQTQRSIQDITSATESISRANSVTQKSINDATIAADQSKIKEAASAEARSAELDALRRNSVAMIAGMNAADTAADARVTMFSVENQAREQGRSKERFKFQREQAERDLTKYHSLDIPAAQARLELLQTQVADATNPKLRELKARELEQAEQEFNDNENLRISLGTSVQDAQAANGLVVEDISVILNGLNSTGATRLKYERLLMQGSSADKALGGDGFSALQTLKLVAPDGNFPRTKYTNMLEQTELEMVEFYAGNLPRDEETLRVAFNTRLAQNIEADRKIIKAGDSSNPFKAPPMESISQYKDVTRTKFYRDVLAPKGFTETNEQAIFDSALEGIGAGIVTPEEAAIGITRVFQAAIDYNNTIDGGFNYIGVPNQTSYIAQIKMPESAVGSLLSTADDLISKNPIPTIAGAAITVPIQLGLLRSIDKFDLSNYSQVQQALIKAAKTTGATVPEPNINVQ